MKDEDWVDSVTPKEPKTRMKKQLKIFLLFLRRHIDRLLKKLTD